MFTNGIILVLASLGLVQGLFLSFYLLTLKGGKRISNLLLALFFIGLTMRIGKSVLNYYVPLEAWQRNIGISGILFVGPCLWLYGKSILEKQIHFKVKHYIHFLPFLLFLFFIPVVPRNGSFEIFWNYGIIVFHLAFYLILSWHLLIIKRSHISKYLFVWFRNLLVGATIIWCFYLGNLLAFQFHYITGPIFYTLLIYAFTYMFLNRHKFNLEKYSQSTLDKRSSKALFDKIQSLFESEALFSNEQISLKLLATKLDVKPREISRAVNENWGQNFYEYVNHHKVKRAENLLKDSTLKHEKMATIAYEAGFNNITSFNAAFKKKNGITPSEFRKTE